jgi:hypothetical protein
VRIQYIAGLRKAFGKHFSTPLMGLAVLVVAVVFVAAIVVAWRSVEARMATTLLVVQFLVLCTSPSFFNFYSSYLAGPLALTVAAAASPAARLNWRAYVAPAAAALAGLITAGALIHSRGLVEPFPGARFDRATTGLRCVMTDSNSALILMNRLSDDLQHGCPNWVDVTGHTYFGVAKSRGPLRRHNQAWQRLVKHYLLSGDAVLRLRPGTGLNRATKQAIDRYPVLARGDGYVLRRVTR